MEQVTRRRLLGLVPGTGVVTLFGPELACAVGPMPNAIELFVVGPLRLGDWFKRGYGEKWQSRIRDVGLDLKTAVTALNAAPLYILDLRDISDPMKPRFAVTNDFPTLVVARQGTHKWKKERDSFRWSLGEMSVGVNSTTGQPPVRKVTAAVQLELCTALQVELTQNTQLVVSESTLAVSDHLTYDVSGKLLVVNRVE